MKDMRFVLFVFCFADDGDPNDVGDHDVTLDEHSVVKDEQGNPIGLGLWVTDLYNQYEVAQSGRNTTIAKRSVCSMCQPKGML